MVYPCVPKTQGDEMAPGAESESHKSDFVACRFNVPKVLEH
jgi:hypothetical protein